MATLSDIAGATGAKPRTVQLWADAGVIVAEHGTDREGSGRHREFGKGEVIIACIVAPFAVDKMAIGGLLNIARTIRHVHPKADINEFNQAIEGLGKSFMVVSLRHFDPVKVTMYSGPLTPMIRIIDGNESNQPLGEFMSHETTDFPMVKILSLNSVLKPLRAMNF
jgi:hypothetical protein